MLFRDAFLFALLIGFVFSVPLATCGTLASNTEYELTADLAGVDGANTYCILASENTTLDCQGHSITSAAPTDVYGIDNTGNINITIKNCQISGYDYGIRLFVSQSAISNNSIDGAEDTNLYLVGDNNTVSYNLLADAGVYNMHSNGDYSNFTNNTAAASNDSCFRTDGDNNILINNSAYFCDLVALDGGAFEIGDDHNILSFNHAENSSNGYYIEGQGILLTNNTAYGNIIGINVLPDGWEGHILIDNIAEENLAFDFMVGGDYWLSSIFAFVSFPSYVCNNTVQNLTGSGGREIYYAWGTCPNVDDVSLSQVIMCGCSSSTSTNITINGSDALNNNGFIAMNSNTTHVLNSNSHDNLAGFWFLNSDDSFLSGVNTSGNFAGVMGVFSTSTRFSGVRSHDNKINASLLLSYMGGESITETIEFGFGALLLGSNDTMVKRSYFYNNSVGMAVAGDIVGGDMARGLDIYSLTFMQDNDFVGLMVLGAEDISIDATGMYNNKGTFPNITSNIPIPGFGSMNLSALAGTPLGFGAFLMMVDNATVSRSEFSGNYDGANIASSGDLAQMLELSSSSFNDNSRYGLMVDDDSYVTLSGAEADSNGESGIYFSTGMLMVNDTNLSSNLIGMQFSDVLWDLTAPYSMARLICLNLTFDSNGDDFVVNKINTSTGTDDNLFSVIGWFGSTRAGVLATFTNDGPEDLYVNTVVSPPAPTLAGYDPLGLSLEMVSNTAFNVNSSAIFYNATDIVGRNASNLQVLEYTGATWVVVPEQENMITPFGNAILFYNQNTFSVFEIFENSTNYTPPEPTSEGGSGSGKDALKLEIATLGHTLDEVAFNVTADGK